MGKNIAIITARGGSKRIYKKNIRDFCGKPIISYSIEAALMSNQFDEVMVSTDDIEIANISKEYGAEVPFFRSSKNSDDYATTEDVILEVLNEYKKRSIEFDYVCCIYPTAPFVNEKKICDCIQLIKENDVEQIIPVVAYSFPPQRCNIIRNDGKLDYKFPQYKKTRSQDLETWYHDAGQFYVYDVKKFIRCKGECTDFMPYILSEMEVQDIDNEVDWELAEIKYKMLK